MYIDLLKEIDFSKELEEEPQLKNFMKDAAKSVAKEQFDSLVKFKKPQFDQDLQNHLILTNIPDLKGGKEQKFIPFFTNFLQKKGLGKKDGLESFQIGSKVVNGEVIYNKTLYMIYKTPAGAKKAYQKLHQLKFDAKHTFACFTVKQFHAVQKISDEYIKPKLFAKKEEVQFNFDENLRDQFVVRAQEGGGDKIYLNWFDNMEKEAKDALNNNPITTKTPANNIAFSPRGTFCAVCQSEGVRIYVGQTLHQKAFFPHKGVIDVAFSPNQTYMISFNGNDSYVKTQENLALWAVQEQIKLTSFKAHPHQDLLSFQFTKDQSKMAIVGNQEIYIHDSKDVISLKKSLKQSQDDMTTSGCLLRYPNIQKIIWLPDNKNLTCVCYELNPSVNSNPSSKIFFYNTETKQERKWRPIGQHIKKVQLAISDYGEWVAVYFKKIQKKSQHASVVYVVNLLKREPETQNIEVKDNVVSISWDKKNNKFGMVYELVSGIKNDRIQYGVAFYQIVTNKDKSQNVHRIGDIKSTPTNRLVLTENGVYFGLYNVSIESSGRYKFTLGYFGKDQKKKPTIEIIKENVEVAYMKFFEIDASGRFILLGTDKAYHIWSMTGELVYKDIFTCPISNVRFRPRYMTHLPLEGEKKLIEREKEIKKKYEEEDQKRINFLKYEKEKLKQEQRVRFREFIEAKRVWFKQFEAKRDSYRGFSEKDPKIKSAKYEYLDRQNN